MPAFPNRIRGRLRDRLLADEDWIGVHREGTLHGRDDPQPASTGCAGMSLESSQALPSSEGLTFSSGNIDARSHVTKSHA
jgi:hypothetical protein